MIRITDKNKDKIMEAIKKAEHRCRARLLTWSEVKEAIKLAEKNPVVSLLMKKEHVGISAIYHPGHGGAIANSYNGIPEETCIQIVRRPSGWFFVKAFRRSCVYSERVDVTVTKDQANAAASRLLTHVTIRG